jgi:hypothetical protein
MSEEAPPLEFLGNLLMKHVRDRTIEDVDRLLQRHGNSVIAARVTEWLATFSSDDIEVVRRLIPIVVDTILHHLLVAFEQWPDVTLGVTAGSARVDDIRTAALGDLRVFSISGYHALATRGTSPPLTEVHTS